MFWNRDLEKNREPVYLWRRVKWEAWNMFIEEIKWKKGKLESLRERLAFSLFYL